MSALALATTTVGPDDGPWWSPLVAVAIFAGLIAACYFFMWVLCPWLVTFHRRGVRRIRMNAAVRQMAVDCPQCRIAHLKGHQ